MTILLILTLTPSLLVLAIGLWRAPINQENYMNAETSNPVGVLVGQLLRSRRKELHLSQGYVGNDAASPLRKFRSTRTARTASARAVSRSLPIFLMFPSCISSLKIAGRYLLLGALT